MRIPFNGKPYVFLSYSHTEKHLIDPLVQQMNDLGYRVWYDRALSHTDDYNAVISGAIKHCSIFLIILSPDAVKSEYIRRELSFAVETCKKQIVAVQLSNFLIPDVFSFFLSGVNVIRKWELQSERQLIHCLCFACDACCENEPITQPDIYNGASSSASTDHIDRVVNRRRIKSTADTIAVAIVFIFLILCVTVHIRDKYYLNALYDNAPNLFLSNSVSDSYLASDDSQVAEPDNQDVAPDVSNVELTLKYRVLWNGKAEITGYLGTGNHATIDSKIDGHEVIRIANGAFEGCTTLTSVLFWADIKEIGDSAFKNCTSLTKIYVPIETTSIGDHAFQGCTNLETVLLWGDPDIGKYAFADCVSLTSISIGLDTKVVGEHAFDGCTSLSDVMIWSDDTIVGKDAFANCPSLEGRPVQE